MKTVLRAEFLAVAVIHGCMDDTSILFQLNIRDVREADAHGGVVTTLLHAAVVNHSATGAGALLVKGGVDSLGLSASHGGHSVGHHLGQR